MREWAHAYGAAVRQRSVRQETTIARAGTLPVFLYQRPAEAGKAIPLEEGYNLRTEQEENFVIDTGDVRGDQKDEVLEYESNSSDEEPVTS